MNGVKWVIEKGKEENCETCLFLGDWHHQRASINVATLNHSVEALTLLSSSFTVDVLSLQKSHSSFVVLGMVAISIRQLVTCCIYGITYK